MSDIFMGGLEVFFGVQEICLTGAGVFLGVVIGVLPGIGPLLGVILFTPIIIQLSPVSGLGLLLGIYVGGSCGGAISAVLLRIPGTPIAAATLLDGYPMAQKGKAPEAIGISIAASALGGLIGGMALMFVSPVLAKIALKFGPPEYFCLTLTGVIAIAVVARESTLKGLISGCFGLLIASIGTDPFTGYDRFTFGYGDLMAGIRLVALLVGLFAISEMFIQIERGGLNVKPNIKIFRPSFSSTFIVIRNFKNLIRSSFIGTFIGSLPGTGGVSSSFISYATAKASSKEPEKFGTGVAEGIIATEGANNACCGGALIPSLALAIPGDPITAVLMGAIMLLGFLPGPELFRQHPDLVGGIFYAYVSANIFLLILGILFAPVFISILKIRKNRLIPMVLILSIVGTYAVQSSLFDVWSIWIFGLIGYAMRKQGFPLAPLCIGRVLGPILEPAFRRSLIMSDGSFSIFTTRPISLIILIINVLLFIWAFVPHDKLERVAFFITGHFRRSGYFWKGKR
ncbi:MAG: tripartite tricarboxylate transporter permease [Deltaproteobacteria bacterium]|nr:tripartite tricarboxylate transporter permease [Deltaproteobacteria bacterium]MBW1961210.1 tripartite tricarboxylate transporter permease [Deltaproteobacteria bacterium]MBW1994130.1 tripartite tricarboxylate transporter permease [Deltaproteobacteria bacterium]MBW2152495.1 tripartite tricarboxylate transporter permease [Deltaproteobacteria bacterium]